MAPQITDQKWYSIAEQASKEMDSAKLMVLVAQLCSALDERDRGQQETYGSSTVPRFPLPNPGLHKETCL